MLIRSLCRLKISVARSPNPAVLVSQSIRYLSSESLQAADDSRPISHENEYLPGATESFQANTTENTDEIPLEVLLDSEPSTETKREVKLDEKGRVYATGRRKSSIARVWVKPGSGLCTVNKQSFVEYFQFFQRQFALEPLNVAGKSCSYDVLCTVKGGGISGQAGAVRLGIARALDLLDTENHRSPLRKSGCLTRDSRVVERKKSGLKKARKQYQWVKR
mmetsp:Transcript_10513/g.7849  ORF Transcript_10513/g.7849 Transcript_10513/m.7849 type:complete len:220 (-) Transcript_10513:103-762(-)